MSDVQTPSKNAKATTETATVPFDTPWLQKAPEGGILFVVASAIASILYLRRRLASDNTAITKDQAESAFVKGLMEELTKARKTLDEVYNERNLLIERVGSLSAEVRLLKEKDERMSKRMAALERRLGINLDSVPGDLGDDNAGR